MNIGDTVRMDYFYLEEDIVTVLVMVAHAPPVDGLPVFQLGYAVPRQYRKQGYAQRAVLAVINEIEEGCRLSGRSEYFVEAIVAQDNKASQGVAAKTISNSPEPIIDPDSDEEVLRYRRRMGRRPIQRRRG
jgi:hypothetical protein